MTFQNGDPATCGDFLMATDNITTYQDAGWEHLGRMASAHVWRRRYQDVRSEAFTDDESIRDRSRRFVGAVSVSIAIFVVGALAMILAGAFADVSAGDAKQLLAAGAVFAAMAVLLAAGAVFAAMAVLLAAVAVRIRRQRDR